MTELTAEQLAQIIVDSIDRHGLRGLIYEADGMADVVMHGKVNMVAVAQDVLAAMEKVWTCDTKSGVETGLRSLRLRTLR